MKITKAQVIIRSGAPDHICLTTDLPSPFACDKGTSVPLFLNFDCMRHQGVEYIRQHFGIEPEVIDVEVGVVV